jgi:oligopeptide/dipeptide ABC transporter ATP-binding protein
VNRLDVTGLTLRYGSGHRALTAVDSVDLAIAAGETHGLVGESGSGKSSIARGIVGLNPSADGRVLLEGDDVTNAEGKRLRRLRRGVQMVFQNPYASLNPRMSVGEIVGEAISVHRPAVNPAGRRREVGELLGLVGLGERAADRFPHQFSGGQRQRIAIARALATEAPVLILDEVTSSLDVSVQATILNLLKALQRQRRLSYLFISHDLAVVRYMSDVVSVMYLGRIVETAPTEVLFREPRHPYTRALMDAVPRPGVDGRSRIRLSGEIPDPRLPPSGCRFHTRCPIGQGNAGLWQRCQAADPPSMALGDRHRASCHAVQAGELGS